MYSKNLTKPLKTQYLVEIFAVTPQLLEHMISGFNMRFLMASARGVGGRDDGSNESGTRSFINSLK